MLLLKYLSVSLLVFGLLFTAFAPVADAAQYTNQQVTAYTAPSNALTYHGTYPTKYYTAAVHPKTCGVPTSGTLFPFGTMIHTDSPIALPGYSGGSRSTFRVEDMGDVRCSLWTTYWFDIYFGISGTSSNPSTADRNAIQFGVKRANYDVTLP